MTGVVVMAYLLGIGFCIVAWGIATHKHPARQDGPEPLPERGNNRRCDGRRCGRVANVWVIVAEDLGGGIRFVCHGCADEGTAHGWWRARLPKEATPLDFEIADDLDHLDDWVQAWRGEAG